MHTIHTVAWTTNAKVIGCMYLACALSFGVSGMLLSWLLRGELVGLGEQLLFGDHHLYNVLITSSSSEHTLQVVVLHVHAHYLC